MSKIIQSMLAILLWMCSVSAICAESQSVTIRAAGDQATGEVIHRAPVQIPIACLLEDDSCLVVTFLADLGTVSVEIENLTTGEYCSSPVNALPGPMIFPISGSVGNWRISFTLPSGVRYSGEFEII